MQKDAKINLIRALVAVDAQQRMFTDMEKMAHDRLKDKRDLELKKREFQDKVDDLQGRINYEKEDREKAEQRAVTAEKDLASERVRREEEEEKQKEAEANLRQRRDQEEGDLERIRATHFDDWVDEWVNTQEGQDWLHESSKSARAMDYSDTVQKAKALHPELDAEFLMKEIPGCEGIGVNDQGEAYFIDDTENPINTSSPLLNLSELLRDNAEYNVARENLADLAQMNEQLRALKDVGFGDEEEVPPDTTGGAEGVAEPDPMDKGGMADIPDQIEDDDDM